MAARRGKDARSKRAAPLGTRREKKPKEKAPARASRASQLGKQPEPPLPVAAAGGPHRSDAVRRRPATTTSLPPELEAFDPEREAAKAAIAAAAAPTSAPADVRTEVPPPATPEEATEREIQHEAIQHSPERTRDFLERARAALLAEGFDSTPMQYRKKGQVFGLVKGHGHDLQIHVRAFDNGVIESEVELSNRYIQHLWSPRRSSHAEIIRVFEKHGVETDTVNTEFRTRTGADRDRLPRLFTRTKDVMTAGVGLAAGVGAVAIARFIQRRSEGGRRGRWRRG